MLRATVLGYKLLTANHVIKGGFFAMPICQQKRLMASFIDFKRSMLTKIFKIKLRVKYLKT